MSRAEQIQICVNAGIKRVNITAAHIRIVILATEAAKNSNPGLTSEVAK